MRPTWIASALPRFLTTHWVRSVPGATWIGSNVTERPPASGSTLPVVLPPAGSPVERSPAAVGSSSGAAQAARRREKAAERFQNVARIVAQAERSRGRAQWTIWPKYWPIRPRGDPAPERVGDRQAPRLGPPDTAYAPSSVR